MKNNLPDLKQPTNPYVNPYQPIFEMVKRSNTELEINSIEVDSGNELLVVPFMNKSVYIPVEFNSVIINTGNSGLGGILDGLSIANSELYHIWAIADRSLTTKGFGITALPTSSASLSSGTKGSSTTASSVSHGKRFTIGCRVRITNGATWNLGTVLDNSNSDIEILLDNETYGTVLTTGSGATIEMLDSYRAPNFYQDGYYRLVGRLWTDSSGNIDHFDYNECDTTLYKTVYGIHKDFVSSTTLKVWNSNYWIECDGSTCMVDRSPLIGQTIPDLNGDGRFLRGSSTSGTLQAATSIYNPPNSNINLIAENRQTRIYNSDGTSTHSLQYNYVGGTNVGPADDSRYERVRPINMSVVWVMKVR